MTAMTAPEKTRMSLKEKCLFYLLVAATLLVWFLIAYLVFDHFSAHSVARRALEDQIYHERQAYQVGTETWYKTSDLASKEAFYSEVCEYRYKLPPGTQSHQKCVLNEIDIPKRFHAIEDLK